MIGSGNLATNIASILFDQGHIIQQVYSNQIANAKTLANSLDSNTTYTDQLNEINSRADLYIFSIKDNALESVVKEIPHNNGTWIHTAGSMDIQLFEGCTNNYGILYPLQTFSKNKQLNWKNIPILIESNNPESKKIISELAHSISDTVYEISSEKRKYIHLSAVFACNFTNCMYSIGQEFAEKTELPFHILLPLINETAIKVNTLPPIDAQTGPAVRMDSFVIDKHLSLIDNPLYKDIYKQISEVIYLKKSSC